MLNHRSIRLHALLHFLKAFKSLNIFTKVIHCISWLNLSGISEISLSPSSELACVLMQVCLLEVNFYFYILSRVLFEFPTCVVLKIAVHAFRARSVLQCPSLALQKRDIKSLKMSFVLLLCFPSIIFTCSRAVTIAAAAIVNMNF